MVIVSKMGILPEKLLPFVTPIHAILLILIARHTYVRNVQSGQMGSTRYCNPLVQPNKVVSWARALGWGPHGTKALNFVHMYIH